jgi:hypothetical protein
MNIEEIKEFESTSSYIMEDDSFTTIMNECGKEIEA